MRSMSKKRVPICISLLITQDRIYFKQIKYRCIYTNIMPYKFTKNDMYIRICMFEYIVKKIYVVINKSIKKVWPCNDLHRVDSEELGGKICYIFHHHPTSSCYS